MAKKNPIEAKWLRIKTAYKSGEFDYNELDCMTSDLIGHLAQLTGRGITEIDGVKVDLYKDRTWNIIEHLGLLPEYRSPKEEDDDIEIVDNYYQDEFEEVEIDDSQFYQ
tara:strand:- start:375 stop:701 length:327 start_codon:yes stop_codon:yes gene_type:complete